MDYASNYYGVYNRAEELRYSFKNSKPVSRGLVDKRTSAEEVFGEVDDFRARYVADIQDYFSGITQMQQKQAEESGVEVPESPLSFGPNVPSMGGGAAVGGSLRDALIFSESSGNPLAFRTNEDGRSFAGLAQIGDARLQDYNKVTGSNLELADLMQNTQIQNDVIDWHLSDLSNIASKLSEETGMDVSGLVAVGHLGGGSGMKRFARSGGKYNPEDQLGTSLRDYYNKFKGLK
jgi:hypothetical protein